MMQGIYACLSYCWGHSSFGQTVESNFLNHLQNVPFDDLPSTIIYFIYLCHKLGFRYLWVDRLCIIQDDPGDWSKEASRTCDIYSKSALTISVPICIKASQSFLSKRHGEFWEQSMFRILDDIDLEPISEDSLESSSMNAVESSSNGSLWVSSDLYGKSRPCALEYDWTHFRSLRKGEANSWFRRGWTLQEPSCPPEPARRRSLAPTFLGLRK